MWGKFICQYHVQGTEYRYWITEVNGQYASNLLGKSVAKRMGLFGRVNEINSSLTDNEFGEIGLQVLTDKK